MSDSELEDLNSKNLKAQKLGVKFKALPTWQ